MREALYIKRLCKTTQNCRLFNVNLSVPSGTVCSVLSNSDAQNDAMMALLTGESLPDSGHLFLDSKCARLISRGAARRLGVYAVYADNHLFLHNSIAENLLVLGYRGVSLKYINHRALNEKADGMLADFGLSHLSASMKPFRLSDTYCHMIEILRAFAQGAKLILIDNITVNYDDDEIEQFLGLLQRVKRCGVSFVLFVSRYSRVLERSDSITVLRNGTTVYNIRPCDITPEAAARALSGYIAEKSESHISISPQYVPILSLINVSGTYLLRNVSFDLMQGEVLGLMDPHMDIGVELVDILCNGGQGSGRIDFHGTSFRLGDGEVFPKGGVVYIAENTSSSVIFKSLSLFDNVTLSVPARLVNPISLCSGSTRKYLFVSAMKKTHGSDLIERLGDAKVIPPISAATRLRILFARCLCSQARVIIIVDTQPSRSPEYNLTLKKLVADVRAAGVSVIIISNDITVLNDNCRRVLMVKHTIIRAP